MSFPCTTIRRIWVSRGWALDSFFQSCMIRGGMPCFPPRSNHSIYFWRTALATDLAKKEESDRSAVELFMRLLDVDEQVAAALAGAELTTIEEVAYVPLAELLEIDAIELALLLALRQRARRQVLVESTCISESNVWEN